METVAKTSWVNTGSALSGKHHSQKTKLKTPNKMERHTFTEIFLSKGC